MKFHERIAVVSDDAVCVASSGIGRPSETGQVLHPLPAAAVSPGCQANQPRTAQQAPLIAALSVSRLSSVVATPATAAPAGLLVGTISFSTPQ